MKVILKGFLLKTSKLNKGMRELQKDKERKKNVSINLKKRKQNLKIR